MWFFIVLSHVGFNVGAIFGPLGAILGVLAGLGAIWIPTANMTPHTKPPGRNWEPLFGGLLGPDTSCVLQFFCGPKVIRWTPLAGANHHSYPTIWVL